MKQSDLVKLTLDSSQVVGCVCVREREREREREKKERERESRCHSTIASAFISPMRLLMSSSSGDAESVEESCESAGARPLVSTPLASSDESGDWAAGACEELDVRRSRSISAYSALRRANWSSTIRCCASNRAH